MEAEILRFAQDDRQYLQMSIPGFPHLTISLVVWYYYFRLVKIYFMISKFEVLLCLKFSQQKPWWGE